MLLGPLSGRALLNKDEFERCEALLKEAGYAVMHPHLFFEHNSAVDFGNDYMRKWFKTGMVSDLMKCDRIVTLIDFSEDVVIKELVDIGRLLEIEIVPISKFLN